MKVSIIQDLIREQLLYMHTAFLGKILSIDNEQMRAKVEPLHMTKQYDKEPEKRPPLIDVPILSTVFKLKEKEVIIENISFKILEKEALKKGDIVLCVCSERDITGAIDGEFIVPTDHHSIKDAIIVGVV